MTTEEVHLLRRLREGLEPSGVDLNLVDSKTMISPKDLPFRIEEIPSVFTSFRKVRQSFLVTQDSSDACLRSWLSL